MARPKLGNGVSERLQMVITSTELDEIERWRFANGIPSKSEAIRRLCQIALFLDGSLETILDLASDGVTTLSEQMLEGVQVDREVRIACDLNDLRFNCKEMLDALRLVYDHDDFALEGVTALRDMLLTLSNGAAGIVNASSFRGGQRALKQTIDRHDKRVQEAAAEATERSENRYIGITFTEAEAERRAAYSDLPEEEKEAYLEKWIDDLRREEASDPEKFAERHGIEPPFWQRAGWASELRKREGLKVGSKS